MSFLEFFTSHPRVFILKIIKSVAVAAGDVLGPCYAVVGEQAGTQLPPE